MQGLKLAAHRTLRRLGYRVERYRDAYADVIRLFGRDLRDCIDGGAYKGTVTESLLAALPSARVHAFEPQPDLAANLRKKFASEDRVSVFQLALSDACSTADFSVNEAAFTSSLLAPTESYADELVASDVLKVETTTLDAWASENAVDGIDFIKLDLQGNEYQALSGASTVLRHRTRAVLTEINFTPRYDGGTRFSSICQLMDEMGFSLFRLYDVRNDARGGFELGDALFIRD